MTFLIPERDERRKISDALVDMDLLVRNLDKLIAKKRNIKQASMQKLWSQSKSWNQIEVNQVLLDHFSGPSPTCEERNIRGSEWGVLRTTCTTWEYGWNWKSHKVLPRSYWGQESRKVRVGDTIITKAGPRHRVGVPSFVDFVPDNIVPSGKMIALRPNPSLIDPLFLSLALKEHSSQAYLNERTTGMAESQVNFENRALLGTLIKVPSLAEQMRIAEVSTSIDAEINALVALREKTALIQIGMMQELLTGRTRLL
jgi:type I restriction enzyme S subunit